MVRPLERLRADGLVTTANALRFGVWPQLQREHARREWVRVWRGVYLPTGQWSVASGEERHRLVLLGLTLARDSPPTAAGLSSAIVWGLPVLDIPQKPEILVQKGDQRARSRVHGVLDRDQPRVHLDGLSATTPEWAVVDVAVRHGFEAAVVVGDAAVRLDLCTREQLRRAALEYASVHVKRARVALEVADFASPLAESPLESLSRCTFSRLGAPPPELQASVTGRDGRTYRVDFLWRSARVVGECDGRGKYGTGADAADSVWREKLREDAIRDAGWRVVRWTWGEVQQNGVLAARLAAAGIVARFARDTGSNGSSA